ncbi:MAG: hypothetical protein WA215_01645, partial [Candidatus Cybelea sp.]
SSYCGGGGGSEGTGPFWYGIPGDGSLGEGGACANGASSDCGGSGAPEVAATTAAVAGGQVQPTTAGTTAAGVSGKVGKNRHVTD